VESGDLQRVARGLYALSDSAPTAHRTLAEAARRIPGGVVCLLSALRFHEITTQLPSQVWLAIDVKARRPKEPLLPLQIVRSSGRALTSGIKQHEIEHVPVKIYGVAKTVADCFKFRNKIGQDVAIEALREALEAKKCTVDELWHFAKICRVANVMRPYMEVLS
jgi:predicted transcriptional regulator of viral defense system